MRRLIPILALGLLLAVMAAWAYVVLRGRPGAPTAAGIPAPATAPANGDAPAQTTPAVTAGHAAPVNSKSSDSSAADARAQAEEAAALRAQLADPEVRQKILNRVMETYSTDSPAGFNHYIGLNGDEYTRLMNMLADQQIEQFRAQLECAEQPPCDMHHVMQTLLPEQYGARVQMLGSERAQRLENYIDYQAVRSGVANLRTLLPESQRLGDAQADKLAEALAAERHRVIEEIGQRGTTPSTIASMQGQIVIPATAEGVDQKFEEAQAYQRRMNSRAAEILTPQQLGVYRQMQEEWLAHLKAGWEKEAATPGAR